MEAIVRAVRRRRIPASPAVVVSDRPGAAGLSAGRAARRARRGRRRLAVQGARQVGARQGGGRRAAPARRLRQEWAGMPGWIHEGGQPAVRADVQEPHHEHTSCPAAGVSRPGRAGAGRQVRRKGVWVHGPLCRRRRRYGAGHTPGSRRRQGGGHARVPCGQDTARRAPRVPKGRRDVRWGQAARGRPAGRRVIGRRREDAAPRGAREREGGRERGSGLSARPAAPPIVSFKSPAPAAAPTSIQADGEQAGGLCVKPPATIFQPVRPGSRTRPATYPNPSRQNRSLDMSKPCSASSSSGFCDPPADSICTYVRANDGPSFLCLWYRASASRLPNAYE